MSLFDNDQTPAQKAASIIRTGTANLRAMILGQYKYLFGQAWTNPKATPEEVFAELGTDAAEVCECSAAVSNLLNEFTPGTVSFGPTQEITIHSDGSALLTPLPSSLSLSSASSESSDSSQSA